MRQDGRCPLHGDVGDHPVLRGNGRFRAPRTVSVESGAWGWRRCRVCDHPYSLGTLGAEVGQVASNKPLDLVILIGRFWPKAAGGLLE